MRITVGQLCSRNIISTNLKSCIDIITAAANLKSTMVFLPEASDFIANDNKETLELTIRSLSEFVAPLMQLAKERKIFISIGVHEMHEKFNDRIYNCHLDSNGDIIKKYRKIHLFDVDIPDGPKIMESSITCQGSRIEDIVATPAGNLGLCTCYDLRFPEQSLLLREKGADIIAYPSAFTLKTGAAHWDILLKARAVETQTFIVAAAQIGKHNQKRESYGHSCVIDPWGTSVGQCSDYENAQITVNIDLQYLKSIRDQMPVFEHKRRDLY